MGIKDTVAKKYLSDADRFADLFNFYLYDGKQVIRPEQLREIDSTEIALPYGRKGRARPIQKLRDVIKSVHAMTDEHYTYLLLAIEEQSNVHYAMPTKNMLYDAIQYASQVEKKAKDHRRNKDKTGNDGEYLSGFYKTDRLVPIITLTVYLGADEWDAPRSLHEMLTVEDKSLLRFIPDYKLNLITPTEILDTDFEKFSSELKQVLKYVKYSNNNAQLIKVTEADPVYRNLDKESAETLNILTSSHLHFEEGKEKIDVCKAIQDMMAESEAKGRAEGEAEGEAKGRVKTLIELVRSGDLTIEKAAEKFGCSVDKFKELMV